MAIYSPTDFWAAVGVRWLFVFADPFMSLPAEPLGPLDSNPWDDTLVRDFTAFTADEAGEFCKYVADESSAVGLDYIKDDGQRIIIPITPAPVIFSPRTVRALRNSFEWLGRAVAQVAAAWLDTPALQQIIPLEPFERAWLELARQAPGNAPEQAFHRWDFALNLSADPDAADFKLFEVNSVDVGGIHYAPAAREVLLGGLKLMGVEKLTIASTHCGADPRFVLMTALMHHSFSIGRRICRVAIAENQDFTTGITEAESLARHLRRRFIKTRCVDARAFETSDHGVCFRGKEVDVVYRNIELRDLADLESAGGDLSGLRQAAREGKLLSSPFGELDHKSLWEALGSPEFGELFTPEMREQIAAHIPWTRLLRPRRTPDRAGRSIDLPEYVRQHRAELVMKPNRSCGGQGVTIGSATAQSAWDQVLDAALGQPDTWIVQDLIPVPRRRTLRVTEEGRFEPTEVYAVYGAYLSPNGIGFVGRASHNPVVNVMQGGGLLAVLGRIK